MAGFVPLTGFEDDVAIVCPVSDTEAVAVTLESRAPFTAQDMDLLRSCHGLISAMVASHWRLAPPVPLKDPDEAALAPLTYAGAIAVFLPGVLTPKERQILQLSFAGFDNRAIAARLAITIGTVKNHKKRLYAKVDVTSEREVFSLFLGYLMGVEPSDLGTQAPKICP